MISYATFHHTLVGDLLLVADKYHLLRSSYLDFKLAPKPGKDWVDDPNQPVLAKAMAQLKQYLDGELKRLTVPLKVEGTDFQKRVYTLVRQVPLGSTTSYSELATKLKMPMAARSIGAAMGKNPLLLFIPDHRVVNSSGAVGGFAGKWNRKPGLLDLEKRLAT